MAKQGEMRLATEREVWKFPYYDLGDVSDNVVTRLHLRTTEGNNIYEFPVFLAEASSHPRFFIGDYAMNNDTVPTLYDSIYFTASDVVWQNIRKKRDGSDIFYNRLQKNTDTYTDKLQWISPWTILGLGGDSDSNDPYYFLFSPSQSDDLDVWYHGSIKSGDIYSIDINKSTSMIVLAWDAGTDFKIAMTSYANLDSSYDAWERTLSSSIDGLSFGHPQNYQLYEEVTLQLDTWVSLNNSNLVANSEGLDLKYTIDTPHIPEGYDQGSFEGRYNDFQYDMDYSNGKIKALSTGNISDGQTCYIHYEYGSETKIYMSRDHDLMQLSSADGTTDWTTTLTDDVDAMKGGSDGVYISIYGLKDLKKYDRNGNLAWEITLSDYPEKFILDNNENYLYYYSYSGYVGRVNLSTQNIDWEKDYGGNNYGLELDYDDSFLYLDKGTSGTYEIDPTDGTQLRNYPKSGNHMTIPPPGDTTDPLNFVSKV